MKCEICGKIDAQAALVRKRDDGSEEELYVCAECAGKERVRRQKKSLRTRKPQSGGLTATITHIGGAGGANPSPRALETFASAVEGLIHDIESSFGGARKNNTADGEAPAEETPPAVPEEEWVPVKPSGAPAAQRLCGALQLEGLFLIGDLDAVKRAFSALDLGMEAFSGDGVSDAGHVYSFKCRKGDEEKASRVLDSLYHQEREARTCLAVSKHRVLADAICRALAILKNCRLLSHGELFDLLSPLRLAARSGYLDGIDEKAILELMESAENKGGLSRSCADGAAQDGPQGEQNPDEIDARDAELADEMNERFEDVVLSEKAERDLQ